MLRQRIAQPATDDEEALNITSMVDVVFILLAFFVLTTRFVGAESDLAVGAADDVAALGVTSGDLPPSVTIRLTPQAGVQPGSVAIRFGNTPLPDGDYAAITERLRAMDLPSLPIVIAADPTLPIDAVARAMDAVLAGPNGQISLAPLEADERSATP